MLYKRDESFRFTFGAPIKGSFKIARINGKAGSSNEGLAYIMDLSPNGMKLSSPLDIPIEEKHFLFEVSFILNNKTILMIAEPKWKKRLSPNSYTYGLVGLDNEETKKEIIEELKEYAKGLQQNKFI